LFLKLEALREILSGCLPAIVSELLDEGLRDGGWEFLENVIVEESRYVIDDTLLTRTVSDVGRKRKRREKEGQTL